MPIAFRPKMVYNAVEVIVADHFLLVTGQLNLALDVHSIINLLVVHVLLTEHESLQMYN